MSQPRPDNLAGKATATVAAAAKPIALSPSAVPTTLAPDQAVAVAIVNNTGLVLSSAAWPIAAAFIAVLFKSDIAAFLERLRNFKGFGIEASTDAYIKKTLDQPVTPPPPENMEEAARPSEALTSLSPSETILSSWIRVEEALNSLLSRYASNPGSMSMQTRLSLLAKVNDCPTGLRNRIMELNNIRNRVSRVPDSALSDESIRLFRENAEQATRELAQLTD